MQIPVHTYLLENLKWVIRLLDRYVYIRRHIDLVYVNIYDRYKPFLYILVTEQYCVWAQKPDFSKVPTLYLTAYSLS